MKQRLLLNVNGENRELFVSPNRILLDVLREDLGLTGVKGGCDSGECGACTVLMDGKPVRSCIVLAFEAEGKEIMTIEGLAKGSKLHPIQRAFIDHHAFQCGFCTPAMIMIAKAFLDNNPEPTEEDARRAIAGNICRCTGYDNVVDAIMTAGRDLKRAKDGNKNG
ncbi:MAG TPA: (2Fe-2S)-binding protein [Deltaproteobacteria bacterium]|nr:MAG: (2Fe-2S)-binding protein [Desulfobacteraceae bacterium 4484_190.3]RLB41669.1 MAG: (2Fe-2S)-binding protein [Deltaproteobacteria bacterium]HDH98890.1 (2Fe-2S)-binding protein [Deltaproteobacteria bacterium]